ncbi:MAG TPA: 16S rRNA (guanine(966)-N(2))-methyltransferase RsmD [Firmicutes bacterium]|nr:16S rRNA (guanine(966)-N(2))-methyltransferase RsmD [Bacillota bacterium]
MVRIIAGSAKGRRLRSLPGLDVRPTLDRVKEALFNILGNRVIDAEFLDIFAGTGNIGIEALSRGALHAVFVDSSDRQVRLIRENLKLTGLESRARVYRNDAIGACRMLGRQGLKFDIIFADPPYGRGLSVAVMGQVDRSAILAPGGIAVVEHSRRDTMPGEIGRLRLCRTERYGDSCLSFYQWEDSPNAEGGKSGVNGGIPRQL